MFLRDFYKHEVNQHDVKRELRPLGKQLRTRVPFRFGDNQQRLICPPEKWRYSLSGLNEGKERTGRRPLAVRVRVRVRD